MSAVYGAVELASEGRLLKVRFRIENQSGHQWDASNGFLIGSQITDAETHAYIEDGPRVALPAAIKRRDSAWIELAVELPESKGIYRVYVSPLEERSGWSYEHGWPFLAIDAVVEEGRVRPAGWRVTTMRGLHWAILLRSFGRALTYPFL